MPILLASVRVSTGTTRPLCRVRTSGSTEPIQDGDRHRDTRSTGRWGVTNAEHDKYHARADDAVYQHNVEDAESMYDEVGQDAAKDCRGVLDCDLRGHSQW